MENQNTLGGIGKDFGSMNMDELLNNIWTAEETQSMATAATTAPDVGGNGQEGVNQVGGGHLQRQGSLTLPRTTISQKKVDHVWKDIAKDFGDGSNVPQRQQTLAEMTLEDFLMTAQPYAFGKPNLGNGGVFGDLARSNNNGDSGFGINLPLNVNDVRNSQQTMQRQQPLMPKQPVSSYGTTMMLPGNGPLSNTGIRGGVVGLNDQAMNNNLMQNSPLQSGGMGMIGLGGGAVGVPAGSSATLSADGDTWSNVPQRQQSLDEIMSLDEFLMRAGVLREDDTQVADQPFGEPNPGYDEYHISYDDVDSVIPEPKINPKL